MKRELRDNATVKVRNVGNEWGATCMPHDKCKGTWNWIPIKDAIMHTGTRGLQIGCFLMCTLGAGQLGCAPSRPPDVSPAEDKPPTATTPASPGKDEAGWKNLSDGKSLTGWKSADFFGAGKVQVEGGAIVMERGKLMTGVTYDRGDFPKMDYEVTLEGKKVEGNDFFCTTTFPVGDAFCSLVVGGWSGKVVGLSSIDGMDASENETRKDQEFKTNQWYRIRLRVSQQRIEAWIDHEKVVDLDTTDRRISIRIECNACEPFGIATYMTTGVVRDIRVRTLGAAEKKALAALKTDKKD